jgi:2-iminobutanoate/2-iminopropanoate deaminase
MADAQRSWQPAFLPGDVPKPVGAYSPAVRAGDFVFISGQVPRDPRTGALGGDDVASQVRQTLANVKGALAAAGATLDDVVSVTVYLADVDDWTKFNDVYKEIFRPPYPTRTAIGANLRGILVEISAVAYVKR